MRAARRVNVAAVLASAVGLGLVRAGDGATAQVPSPVGADAAAGWVHDAAASDEFDDAAAGLAPAKWVDKLGDWNGNIPGYFTGANVAVGVDDGGDGDGGALVLTAAVAEQPGDGGPDDDGCDCGLRNVSLGLVASRSAYQYGYFEVEARAPADSSVMASFWLQGESGEINVLEMLAGAASTNIRCFGADPDETDEAPEPVPADLDLADGGFHTVGLDWGADGLTFYVDGELVRTAAAGCLDQPMTVVLSVENPAAAVPAGLDAAGAAGHRLEVRHFRRWTKDGLSAPGPHQETDGSSSGSDGGMSSGTVAAVVVAVMVVLAAAAAGAAVAAKRGDRCKIEPRSELPVRRQSAELYSPAPPPGPTGAFPPADRPVSGGSTKIAVGAVVETEPSPPAEPPAEPPADAGFGSATQLFAMRASQRVHGESRLQRAALLAAI